MSAFDRKNNKLDLSREVREVKKALPYTITAIGDDKALSEWKLYRHRKEEEYQIARARRWNGVTAKLQKAIDFDSIYLDTVQSESSTTEAHKRFMRASGVKLPSLVERKEAYIQQKPWYSRVLSSIINYFLNVNYTPKG